MPIAGKYILFDRCSDDDKNGKPVGLEGDLLRGSVSAFGCGLENLGGFFFALEMDGVDGGVGGLFDGFVVGDLNGDGGLRFNGLSVYFDGDVKEADPGDLSAGLLSKGLLGLAAVVFVCLAVVVLSDFGHDKGGTLGDASFFRVGGGDSVVSALICQGICDTLINSRASFFLCFLFVFLFGICICRVGLPLRIFLCGDVFFSLIFCRVFGFRLVIPVLTVLSLFLLRLAVLPKLFVRNFLSIHSFFRRGFLLDRVFPRSCIFFCYSIFFSNCILFRDRIFFHSCVFFRNRILSTLFHNCIFLNSREFFLHPSFFVQDLRNRLRLLLFDFNDADGSADGGDAKVLVFLHKSNICFFFSVTVAAPVEGDLVGVDIDGKEAVNFLAGVDKSAVLSEDLAVLFDGGGVKGQDQILADGVFMLLIGIFVDIFKEDPGGDIFVACLLLVRGAGALHSLGAAAAVHGIDITDLVVGQADVVGKGITDGPVVPGQGTGRDGVSVVETDKIGSSDLRSVVDPQPALVQAAFGLITSRAHVDGGVAGQVLGEVQAALHIALGAVDMDRLLAHQDRLVAGVRMVVGLRLLFFT